MPVFGSEIWSRAHVFQEASQGWESFPHLNTVELYPAGISMNQQRVDAVFVCLRLACMCTVAICVWEMWKRRERESVCVCVCWAQQGACCESTVQGFSVLPLTQDVILAQRRQRETEHLQHSACLWKTETEKEYTWHSGGAARKPTLWRKWGS